MAGLSFDQFFADHRRQVETLYQSSGAARWSVTLEDFARVAWRGIAPPACADTRQIPQLLEVLRAGDLALALACLRGNEQAWDTFCSEYRSVLYQSAYALAHQEGQARELADSVLAELYGLDASLEGRGSRFAYFHGRSSLRTWLRAVLYQKFVDEYRRQSRLAPLPEEIPEPTGTASSLSEEDERHYAECLSEAVEAALQDLTARERLLLSYYYVQELTLKQIGKLSGEHEGTISRHLEALRKRLRKRIENHLRKVKNLTAFEVDRCLDFASRGVTVKLERVLKPD